MAEPCRMILDTDPGIDDAMAILFALRRPGIRLEALTTVFGNTDVDTATVNALRILELAGRSDIPVGIGQNQGPMPEERRNMAPWLAGYDLAKYPGQVHVDGIGALIELVMKFCRISRV